MEIDCHRPCLIALEFTTTQGLFCARLVEKALYDGLESQQIERRKFMTGRRRNDESRPPSTLTDMRTSIIVDKAQYAIVREIALRECMTIKEIICAMFELGINRYMQKHGKVHVRKPKGEGFGLI